MTFRYRDGLYVTSDVARRMDRSTAWVRQLVDQGRLVPIGRTPGGIHIFDPSDIDAFVAEREAQARARAAASERVSA